MSNTDRIVSRQSLAASGDLQDLVRASKEDTNDMERNLAKLRALSSDDKTENALLRSRINEQSELIMILKQRVDEASISAKTLDRINKELEDFRNSAQEELDMQHRKYNMLDDRFNDLASNHEQLIEIKDEYKRTNEELRRENFRLRQDNERIFSKELEDRNKKIKEIEAQYRSLSDQHARLSSRNKQVEESFQMAKEQHSSEIKGLQSKLAEAEERLKGAEAKLIQQSNVQNSSASEYTAKLEKVTKEKDELLTLAMSRGKLIQEKQAENKKLEAKVQQFEKTLQAMEEKVAKESAALNVNANVRKLKMDLTEAEERYSELEKQFGAFKKHTHGLIQREKDINLKLRNLVG